MNFTVDDKRAALQDMIKSLAEGAFRLGLQHTVISEALSNLTDESQVDDRIQELEHISKEIAWTNIKLDQAVILLSNLS
jgi:dsDNA-specific endonuclease/ATPase MutS2